jgi:hypothetical protein
MSKKIKDEVIQHEKDLRSYKILNLKVKLNWNW